MIVAINPTAKQRETDWICVCPNCQHERVITYAQKWNLEKGNSRKECRSCRIELGLQQISLIGLEKSKYKENQEKAAKARTGIKRPSSKKVIELRQLFAPETLTNPEMKEKQRAAKLGKTGELANNWQGGKTDERRSAMAKFEYKELRITVFQRDDYTCVLCNKHGGELQMDHIKEWCNYPELRYDINNCRTLCKECHKKTDNYAGKALKNKAKLVK